MSKNSGAYKMDRENLKKMVMSQVISKLQNDRVNVKKETKISDFIFAKSCYENGDIFGKLILPEDEARSIVNYWIDMDIVQELCYELMYLWRIGLTIAGTEGAYGNVSSESFDEFVQTYLWNMTWESEAKFDFIATIMRENNCNVTISRNDREINVVFEKKGVNHYYKPSWPFGFDVKKSDSEEMFDDAIYVASNIADKGGIYDNELNKQLYDKFVILFA